MSNLTQKRLKEVLYYDPTTGIFIRKSRTGSRNRLTKEKICKSTSHSHGYLRIGIDGQRYYAHQLAWFYVYGVWVVEIDHIDTVVTHNWIKNLREVTRTLQNQNKIKANSNNQLKIRNVSYDKQSKKFIVRIMVLGKVIRFGRYSTKDLAEAAAIRAKHKYHKV
jgi:hypothetical protein